MINVKQLKTTLRLIALFLLTAPLANAASVEQKQAMVIMRSLSYERSLEGRVGERLVIGLVESSDKSCLKPWAKAFKKMRKAKIKGRKIESKRVKVANLPTAIKAEDLDVLFVCNLNPAELKMLVSASQKSGVLSVSSQKQLVEEGLTLSVYQEGTKQVIFINLRSAKKEGIRFSSKLLTLAKVKR